MSRADVCPTVRDLCRIPIQKSIFPYQSDGQQIARRLVHTAAEFRLPKPVPRDLRPAAQPDQQLMKIRFRRPGLHTQPLTALRQCRAGIFRGRCHMGGEAREPDDLGRKVPTGKGTPAPERRCP